MICVTLRATCVLPGLLLVSAFCRNALFQSVASRRSSVVEHLICNQRVGGSSPFAGSSKHLIKEAGVVEWLMAPGCKPGGLTPYAGSNPAPCTRRARMKAEG